MAAPTNNGVRQGKIDEVSELAGLIAELHDDETLREYARKVTISRSHVTFKIDRHEHVRRCVQKMSERAFSHAFGAVLGPGMTDFRGPFAYIIIVVDQLDNPDCSIYGQPLGDRDIIEASEHPTPILVKTGRLLVLAFAFHRPE